MAYEHELVPGTDICKLGAPERLALLGLRMVAAGRRNCMQLVGAFNQMLDRQGPAALAGLETMAERLPAESLRTIILCAPNVRAVSWDEAAVLALIESAQRSAPKETYLWLRRLGVGAMTPELQRGLVWTAAAFVASDQRFDSSVAHLTRARQPAAPIFETRQRPF